MDKFDLYVTPLSDGGPAFPTGIITDEKGKIIGGSNGMTLRDYFASSALHSFNVLDIDDEKDLPEQMAVFAYRLADAMIKQRNQ